MYGLLYIRATRGCRRQSPAPGSRTFLSLQHLCRRREGGSVRPPSHPAPPAAAAEPQRRPQRTNRVKKAPFYKICLRTKRNKETKQQQQQKKKPKKKNPKTILSSSASCVCPTLLVKYCIDMLPALGGQVALRTEVVEPKGQVG